MVSSDCTGNFVYESLDDSSCSDGPEEYGAYEQQLACHVSFTGENSNCGVFNIITFILF